MTGFISKVRENVLSILAVIVIVSLVGAFLLFVYFNRGMNPRLFISDVHESALMPEYAGSLSNAAVVVLWSSAVIAAVGAKFGTFVTAARRRFVASIAAVNGLLALDDFFMGHEYAGLVIARAVGSENEGEDRQVLEAFVFAVFIALFVLWLYWMRNHLLNSPYPLLLLGVLGFGSSVGVDLLASALPAFDNLEERYVTVIAVLEDLEKFMGVGGLTLYAWKSATPHLDSDRGQVLYEGARP